jgi:hypothetical protein
MNDEELAEAVARLYADVDPVPEHLLRLASGTLAWRDPDAALAALVLDSATTGAAAGIRAAPDDGVRMLSFESGADAVDVELAVEDGRVHLVGQLGTPAVTPVRIRHTGGVWTGTTDALGRFAVPSLPTGPLRIAWGQDGAEVSTPTFLT